MTEKKPVKKTVKKPVKKEPKVEPVKENIIEEKAPVQETVSVTAPMKIRMLMSLANPARSFEVGHVYIVGVDLSLETAGNWTRNGVAVEVKEVEPEEIKEK